MSQLEAVAYHHYSLAQWKRKHQHSNYYTQYQTCDEEEGWTCGGDAHEHQEIETAGS